SSTGSRDIPSFHQCASWRTFFIHSIYTPRGAPTSLSPQRPASGSISGDRKPLILDFVTQEFDELYNQEQCRRCLFVFKYEYVAYSNILRYEINYPQLLWISRGLTNLEGKS